MTHFVEKIYFPKKVVRKTTLFYSFTSCYNSWHIKASGFLKVFLYSICCNTLFMLTYMKTS